MKCDPDLDQHLCNTMPSRQVFSLLSLQKKSLCSESVCLVLPGRDFSHMQDSEEGGGGSASWGHQVLPEPTRVPKCKMLQSPSPGKTQLHNQHVCRSSRAGHRRPSSCSAPASLGEAEDSRTVARRPGLPAPPES